MENEFYNQYQNLTKKEVIEILLAAKDYQPEAVSAAKRIAIERNWFKDFETATQKIEDIE